MNDLTIEYRPFFTTYMKTGAKEKDMELRKHVVDGDTWVYCKVCRCKIPLCKVPTCNNYPCKQRGVN